MLKAKKYDWKDSNMALFGSDTEKQVKKESAETEPAWKSVSDPSVGLTIWRIVKFKVVAWPKDQYGEFYNGDSYIILNVYKEPEAEELSMDVHFWIGKYSTQDEYGTAAYKTVELDTFLDDVPIQHREVQGNETKLFKSYFENMTLLKGGADTGFRRVLPEKYEPRLFHIQGTTLKNCVVKQVPIKKGNLNDQDSFILDRGTELLLYSPAAADKDEKFKASQYANQLASSRYGKCKLKADQRKEQLEEFLKDGQSKKKQPTCITPKLLRIKDGKDMEEIASGGDVNRDKLGSDDVYVIDVQAGCFIWIGKNASVDERRNGMSYACNYIHKTDHPCSPITVIPEGKESKEFQECW